MFEPYTDSAWYEPDLLCRLNEHSMVVLTVIMYAPVVCGQGRA